MPRQKGWRGFDPAPVLALQQERNDSEFSDLLGVSRLTIQRWRQGRTLTTITADRIALDLGRHPVNMWPEWEVRDAAVMA